MTQPRTFSNSVQSHFIKWIKLSNCTHSYEESIAVWDLVVDDGLYIDRLQLELYGNINEP